MVYPAQTSLIPIQIALARFLEQGESVFGNYPYWYLGTTPFRYLTGPILPMVLAGLHKLLPFLSLFEIFLGLIGLIGLIGGIGVYWLVVSLANFYPVPNGTGASTSERRSPPSEECIRPPRRRFAFLAAVFYLLGPIVPFLFRFSDGLYLIAFSFLPYTLLMYFRLLRRWERKTALSCIVLITFLLLLDSLILPTLILGMGAIFLAQVGWKGAEEKLRQSFLLLIFAFLISTTWYTPGYWLTLLVAPSLAGKGLAGVIVWLGKLLPTVLAFGLAIFSVRFFKKRNLLRDFCFYWLFIFGFLTLLRFLSDPDFWLDWTAYGIELQFGLVLFGGLLLSRASGRQIISFVVCCVLGVGWLFLTNKYVLGTLQRDITKTVEYKIGSQLSQIVKPHSASSGQAGEKVFLSGTTAFWLNAFFDIPQVRGGVDQASVDSNWRKAVWEIRSFGSAQDKEGIVLKYLKSLNISYLVVHTKESEEYYHDFKYPEKFEEVEGLKKVYDEGGDRIYKVED